MAEGRRRVTAAALEAHRSAEALDGEAAGKALAREFHRGRLRGYRPPNGAAPIFILARDELSSTRVERGRTSTRPWNFHICVGAWCLTEVLKQFGPLPPELAIKSAFAKYASVRALR